MSATISAATIEADVREFARLYPTPNVRRMIALCESGAITWEDAYRVSVEALAKSLA